MTYRVELTEGAYADLDRLMAALEAKSEGLSDQLSARFHEALSRIESLPFSCGLAYENGAFPEELRHLLFGVRKGRSYRALFIIRGDIVKILCIRAPGEKPVRPEDHGF